MQLEVKQFNDHISYLDNGLLDAPGFACTYLVRGDELAIVETGTSLCAPNVLDGLLRLGVKPADVRHIVLTHVHMDHAAGTGTLLPSMPDAQVYIHSRTSRFLIDPSELMLSAERALGPIFPLHGPVEPVPAERIVHADDLRLDLGRGVVLRAVASPGHSPDHLAYYEEQSRALFSGDALGIDVPTSGYIGPMTPPPATSVEAQRDTFANLLALDVDAVLYSHYGPRTGSTRGLIEMQQERYEQLVSLVQTQWEAGHVDNDAIVQAMLMGEAADDHRAWVMANWINMSVNGVALYFERQAKKARDR